MSNTAYPFTDGSFWVSPPAKREPAIAGRERCDVAIIGGGITGLAAALRLKGSGADVALLEADFCGSGASGSNAGHITPTIGKDAVTCIRKFGNNRGLALVRFAEGAVTAFEEVIEHYGIDCDYLRTGNIIAGVHERQRAALLSSAEKARACGLDLQFLDEAEMRKRAIPEAFRFGVWEGSGGTIHPGRYVMGLRQAAVAAGIRIYEDSRVTRIAEGATIALHTEGGVIEAPQVLLAINAYAPSELGLMTHKILPVRVSLFATQPLSEKELSGIGWAGREGIYTAHEALENYRLTADHRIIGGSKVVNYAYGSKLASGYQPKSFTIIKRAFHERFPTLKAVPIEIFWGGWIAMTLDFLPIAGRMGSHKNLVYYSGCNGHGIPQCTMMGAVMADELLGKKSAHLDLLRRFQCPLPPEPLRMAIFNLIKGHLDRIDRRIDRELRPGGGASL